AGRRPAYSPGRVSGKRQGDAREVPRHVSTVGLIHPRNRPHAPLLPTWAPPPTYFFCLHAGLNCQSCRMPE
ncbi:hypothetical protein FHG87_018309, partial [Trinorchestia longiramus]